jgi:predicted DNA-binding transcriptional regulator YafY
MSKHRPRAGSRPPGAISSERSARLYRLLRLLRDGPKARKILLQRLKLDLRGFYRDLEKLRQLGIVFRLDDHHYRLARSFESAMARLPFPDPQLSLHEAMMLGRGKTPAHRKIRLQVRQIMGDRH